MAKTKNGEDGQPGIGHNGLSEQGKAFVERVENLNRDLATMKADYMNECKSVRGDIKEVLNEAADAGITRKTIKTAVEVRALERKAKQARDDLDIADRDTFDNIRLALGDLADTPLGAAATGPAPAQPGA